MIKKIGSNLAKLRETHFYRIHRLTVELDGIFSGSILFNFVSGSVIICVVGFLVTTADHSIEVVKYSFTLISSVIQVYIVCLMGDKFIISVNFCLECFSHQGPFVKYQTIPLPLVIKTYMKHHTSSESLTPLA